MTRPRMPADEAATIHQLCKLPALRDDEAEAVRQVANLTGLPPARIIRLVTSSKLWRAQFLLVTYSAAAMRDWSDSTDPRKGPAPVKQQEHVRDFAAWLMEDTRCAASSP